jgi:hypothetical protein
MIMMSMILLVSLPYAMFNLLVCFVVMRCGEREIGISSSC